MKKISNVTKLIIVSSLSLLFVLRKAIGVGCNAISVMHMVQLLLVW